MNAEEKREIQKTVGVVSIGTYTLERALADVIEYHGTCSISAGLKAATHTLQELNRE